MADPIKKALEEKKTLEARLENLREQRLKGDIDSEKHDQLREEAISKLKETNEAIERFRFESEREIGKLIKEIEQLRSELQELGGKLQAGEIDADTHTWKSESLRQTIRNIEKEISSIRGALRDDVADDEVKGKAPDSEKARMPLSVGIIWFILENPSRAVTWLASFLLILFLFLPTISDKALNRYVAQEAEGLGLEAGLVGLAMEEMDLFKTLSKNSSIFKAAFTKTVLDSIAMVSQDEEFNRALALFKVVAGTIFFVVLLSAVINALICRRRAPPAWRVVQAIVAIIIVSDFILLKTIDPALIMDSPEDRLIMAVALNALGPAIYVLALGGFCLGVSALPLSRMLRLPSPAVGVAGAYPPTGGAARDLVASLSKRTAKALTPSLSISGYVAVAAVGISFVSLFLPWISESPEIQLNFSEMASALAEEQLAPLLISRLVFALLLGFLVASIYSEKGMAALAVQAGAGIGILLSVAHMSGKALDISQRLGETTISSFVSSPGLPVLVLGVAVVCVSGLTRLRGKSILLVSVCAAEGVAMVYFAGVLTAWFGFHQPPLQLSVLLAESDDRIIAHASLENPRRRKLWVKQTNAMRENSYQMQHLLNRGGTEAWEQMNIGEWLDPEGKECFPIFLGPRESFQLRREFSIIWETDAEGKPLKESQAGVHRLVLRGADSENRIVKSFDIAPLENPEWMARQLLDEAKAHKYDGDFDQARSFISVLQEKYPTTRAARYAAEELGSIDQVQSDDVGMRRLGEANELYAEAEAHFNAREYKKTQNLCEKLTREYPEISAGMDVAFMLEEATLLQDPSERRFRGILKKIEGETYQDSIAILEEFIKEYPTSMRVGDAGQAIDHNQTQKRRADYLYKYAEEYYEEQRHTMAVSKYRALIENFPRSRWTPKIKARLKEISKGR